MALDLSPRHWLRFAPIPAANGTRQAELLVPNPEQTSGWQRVEQGDLRHLCTLTPAFTSPALAVPAHRHAQVLLPTLLELGQQQNRDFRNDAVCVTREALARAASECDAARTKLQQAQAALTSTQQTQAEEHSKLAAGVEAVSAADVLAGVEESGPNYALPTAREGQRERRERLRVDETAKQAGHTIVETGTHVEILGEQGLWWPATIAGREEDVDGRLVHEVEYDGYQGEQYWHMLDDEQWRRATAMPTPANGTTAAASTEGEESGGEEDAVAAGKLSQVGR